MSLHIRYLEDDKWRERVATKGEIKSWHRDRAARRARRYGSVAKPKGKK